MIFEPITLTFYPENDITGFIPIIILILFIIFILAADFLQRLTKRIKQQVNTCKYKINQYKFNKFYQNIIDNKILLSSRELEQVKNNFNL